MLSMNGIIVCELILGGVLMGLIFTSFANTDLIADPWGRSKNTTQSEKPGLALTDRSPHVHASLSGDLLGESDGGGSSSSGK